MIDIGNTLRDARKRRGLELAECELATRIRARYLGAMEDERFDALPEPAYARGFLRAYATFLGLDSRVLVEEFDDRFGAPVASTEPLPGLPDPPRRRVPLPGAPVRRRRPRRHKGALAWLVAGALGVLLLALWVGAAWDAHPGTVSVPSSRSSAVTGLSGGGIGSTSTAPAAPVTVGLVGSPATGSWVIVRRAGASGALLFSGFIRPDAEVDFSAAAGLWLHFDAGTAVQLLVAGRPVELPGGLSALSISPAGVVGAG